MKSIRLAVAVLAGLVATSAHADCDHFKWSIAKERASFAASPARLAATGSSAEVGTAYALALAENVKLPVTPERKPSDSRYGAVVTVPKLEAGLYQVTLSDEAWIDVVQNGAIVKSSDFSGQRDCPGVRKTVRFHLTAAPAMIEISNSATPKLNIEISASH